MSSIDEDDNKLRQEGSTETNAQGNKLVRSWAPKDRYWFDEGPGFKFFDLPTEGWTQYDTDQDAPYFGMWINDKELMTLCYCEGDVNIVSCVDEDSYAKEIEALDKWRDETC